MSKKSFNTIVALTAVSCAAASLFVAYATLTTLRSPPNPALKGNTFTEAVGAFGAYALETRTMPPRVTTGTGFQKALLDQAMVPDTGRLLISQFQKCSDSAEKVGSLSVVNGYLEAANIPGFGEPVGAPAGLAKKSKWFTYSQAFDPKGESKLIDFDAVGWAPTYETTSAGVTLPTLGDVACPPLETKISPYPFKTFKDLETAAKIKGVVTDLKGRAWDIHPAPGYLVAKLHDVKDAVTLTALSEEFETAATGAKELPASRSDISFKTTGVPTQIVRSSEYRYSSGGVKVVTSDSRVKNATPAFSVMWKIPGI